MWCLPRLSFDLFKHPKVYTMKETQSQRILSDLLQGIHVNMLNDIKRYGTSCRSRISELRAEGYPIEGYSLKGENYLIYFLPEQFLKEYNSKKEVA